MADNQETKIFDIQVNAAAAIQQLVEYNKAIDENIAKQQALELEDKKSSAEYEVLTQKIIAQKRERRELQKEVQNEIKQQRDEKTSLRAMRAELSNLTKQYDSLSKAERENAAVGGKLAAEIKNTTKAIKEAEYATDRYYRNVGNYTNSILAAVGGNNKFTQSLLGMAGGADASFKGMAAGAKAFGTSLSSLMANPVFLAIAGIVGVGVAASFWADYNDGISEATRLTREFTGYSGQQLTELRASIMATSEVMGKDYTDVLKTADSLMAHYHITGAEAMDVINKGFAAGADLNGDMLQQIQANAAAMHDAGLSAQQLMAIITQTRSGIFGQDGLQAITQGAIRLREMSDSLAKSLNNVGINAADMEKKLRDGSLSSFEALQQIGAVIKELPDNAQETGEVIKEVFGRTGRKASQEMLEGLANMNTELGAVLKQTGDYGELLLEQISSQTEVEKSAAELFAVEGGGWEAVKMKCEIYFNYALTALLSYWNMGKKFWKHVFESVAGFGLKIGAAVQGAGDMFGYVFAQVKKLGAAFTNLGAIIANAITGNFEGAAAAWDKLKNLGSSVVSDYGSAMQSVRGRFTAASGKAGELHDWLWSVGDYSDATGGGTSGAGAAAGGNAGTSGAGGKSGGGKSKGGSTGKSDAEKAAEKAAKDRAALAKKLMQAAAKMRDDALKKDAESGIAAINKYYAAQRTALEQEYTALGTKSDEENAAYQQLLEDNEAKRAAAVDDFLAKQKTKAAEEAGALIDLQLQGVQAGSNEEMLLRLAQLDLQYQQEQEKYKNNAAALEALELAHEQKRLAIEQDYANRATAAQQARYDAVAGALGASAQLMEQFGKKSRAAAVASKVLGLGQIAVAQGVAIAQGVKDAMAVPFPGNLAAIATTIAAIMAAITQAISTVQGAKFATGGYVSGPGTGTSDSIPAHLSNGESVLNANSTAMFGGLLSSLNMLGGGVPIQAGQSAQSAAGEEMLARAFARGAAAVPAPVVGVREFTRVSERVTAIKESAKL